MQDKPPYNLSKSDLKITLLALAHLSNFLPHWSTKIRQVADRLAGLEGRELFEHLKSVVEHSEATLAEITEEEAAS